MVEVPDIWEEIWEEEGDKLPQLYEEMKKIAREQEQKPIKTYKKSLYRLGGSRAVSLPAWWIDGAEEVEMRVYIDRIEIRKIEEGEVNGDEE